MIICTEADFFSVGVVLHINLDQITLLQSTHKYCDMPFSPPNNHIIIFLSLTFDIHSHHASHAPIITSTAFPVIKS